MPIKDDPVIRREYYKLYYYKKQQKKLDKELAKRMIPADKTDLLKKDLLKKLI